MHSIEKNEKLSTIYNKYLRLNTLLTYEEVLLDKKLCLHYQKLRANIAPIAENYDLYLQTKQQIEEYLLLRNNCSEEEQNIISQEIAKLENTILSIKESLIKNLNKYEAEIQEIIVEIISPTDSLNLEKILTGYTNFCKNNELEIRQTQNKNSTILQISGLNAKEYFKDEIGIHNFENQDIQIFVYNKFNEPHYTFQDNELLISTTHSSGAGGQHINTTDSAVKITHIPTGIFTTCQTERSQLQNKENALDFLKKKVQNFINSNKENFIKNEKKEQLKLIKNKYFSKHYNLAENTIEKHNKNIIKISEFLKGNIL